MRITRTLRALGVAAAVVVVTVAGLAVPASAARYGYLLKPGHTNLCLQPAGVIENVQIVQRACDNTIARQYWSFEATSAGYYRIRNVATEMCMNVQGSSTANGAKIIQYPCTTSALNDQFFPDFRFGRDTDYYNLRLRHSPNQCLNVPNASTAAGTGLILYNCTTSRTNDTFTWVNQLIFP